MKKETTWSSRSSAGVAHDRSEAKVTVVGVPDKPGKAAEIFQAVADAEINIDMIVQNVSAAETGRPTSPSRCPRPTADGVAGARADPGRDRLRGAAVRRPHRQGLAGRRRDALAPRCLRDVLQAALAETGVNVEMISTSEIRISVITRDSQLDDAVRAVHTGLRSRRRRRSRRLRRVPDDEHSASPRWPSSVPPARSAPSCSACS
jgi:aspartate kinase